MATLHEDKTGSTRGKMFNYNKKRMETLHGDKTGSTRGKMFNYNKKGRKYNVFTFSYIFFFINNGCSPSAQREGESSRSTQRKRVRCLLAPTPPLTNVFQHSIFYIMTKISHAKLGWQTCVWAFCLYLNNKFNVLMFNGYIFCINATFNNFSVQSWRSVLLVEETGRPGENHQPVASHWQTLSHNVVHLALVESRTPNISGDGHYLNNKICSDYMWLSRHKSIEPSLCHFFI